LLWTAPYKAEEAHFTSDGKYLIAAPGGHVEWRIWDAEAGEAAKDLHPPTGYVRMFAISPDDRLLILPTDTDYILWDVKEGREKRRWPAARQTGRGVFAPDGRSVVLYDTILRRIDLETGKNLYAGVASRGHAGAVRRLFFAADGKQLVSV